MSVSLQEEFFDQSSKEEILKAIDKLEVLEIAWDKEPPFPEGSLEYAILYEKRPKELIEIINEKLEEKWHAVKDLISNELYDLENEPDQVRLKEYLVSLLATKPGFAERIQLAQLFNAAKDAIKIKTPSDPSEKDIAVIQDFLSHQKISSEVKEKYLKQNAKLIRENSKLLSAFGKNLPPDTSDLVKAIKESGFHHGMSAIKPAGKLVEEGKKLFAIVDSVKGSPLYHLIYKPDAATQKTETVDFKITDGKYNFTIEGKAFNVSKIEEISDIIQKVQAEKNAKVEVEVDVEAPEPPILTPKVSEISLEKEVNKYLRDISSAVKALTFLGGLKEDRKSLLDNLSKLMQKHATKPTSEENAREFLNELIKLYSTDKTRDTLLHQIKNANKDAILLLAQQEHAKFSNMYSGQNKQKIDSFLAPTSLVTQMTSLSSTLTNQRTTFSSDPNSTSKPKQPTSLILKGPNNTPKEKVKKDSAQITKENTSLVEFKENLEKEIEKHNKITTKEKISWNFTPAKVDENTKQLDVSDKKTNKPLFKAVEKNDNVIVEMPSQQIQADPQSTLMVMRAMGQPIEVDSRSARDLDELAKVANKDQKSLVLSKATLEYIEKNPKEFENLSNEFEEVLKASQKNKTKLKL